MHLHFFLNLVKAAVAVQLLQTLVKQRISDENNVSDLIAATSCMQHLSIEVV